MSRASASMRSSSSSAAGRDSAAAPSAFGGGALLRTKHIDTLQVLETYSRDVDRLTRENQSLTEKLSKLTSLSGDPFAQLTSLQTILQVERDSNHELQSRIKIFTMEADRHRSELSNRDASLRDLSQQLSALRSEHDALRSTHSSCIASRQSLHESIDQLSRRNAELESHSGDVQSLRAQLDKQSSRLQQLEIQAALGPPLPVTAPANDDAAKQLKAKLAKSKEKLTAAQAELSACKAMLEQEQTRAGDQLAANKTITESVRKLQAELAALSQQQQQQQPAPVSARPSKPQLQQSKDELARREKEWNAERKDLLSQLEAARKAAPSSSAAAAAATAAAAAAAAAAPARPSASERESRELILHLQSEVSSLRSQLEHLHAQNTHLRAEHTKVSQALNKLLASGGGGAMGGLAVGGGKQASITIASKQGGFAEVMSIKRENEALRAQITEAQQIIQMLQHKIGTQQSAPTPNAAVGAAPAASTNPARRSGRSSGSGQFSVSAGSKSLQLIAAHEAEHGPVSAVQSSGSRQSSPPAVVSSLRGSPPRSSTMQAGVAVANQQRR